MPGIRFMSVLLLTQWGAGSGWAGLAAVTILTSEMPWVPAIAGDAQHVLMQVRSIEEY